MESSPIPENFKTIINDFTNDLSITFPEYTYLWDKWRTPDISDEDLAEIFNFCVKAYPERFFDILYQKEEIFNENDDTNVNFLPNVSFKLLYSCENVSEQTKKTIWKYLQLILFTVVGGVKDKTSFGDAANMFEGIGEEELHSKLQETMEGMTDFFKNMTDNLKFPTDSTDSSFNETENPFNTFFNEEDSKPGESTPFDKFSKTFKDMGMPDISKVQEHLKTIFEGKIGKLAKEMAEEISEEFSDLLGKDGGDIKNPQDIIKKLMKDPKKVMELMKTVGGKLDNKMKSGEISREELMKEASEMMNKMKDMGGNDSFNDMFKNMAKNMGAMGKNMKMDTNALDRMTKMMSTKDRLRSKVDLRKQSKMEEEQQKLIDMRKRLEEQEKLVAKYSLETKGDNPSNFVFKLDGEEPQQRSFIHPDLLKEIEEDEKKKSDPSISSNSNKKKKKKGKK
jgi:hypothetical protein